MGFVGFHTDFQSVTIKTIYSIGFPGCFGRFSFWHKGVVVSFRASTFFEANSTDLNAKGIEELTRFSKLIFLLPNRIQIEGHTNDSEPKNWSSNWELSGARAAKVARFFVDNGMDPTKIIAKGFGSTRPKFSNDSPTKRKLNNRVEVIVLGE